MNISLIHDVQRSCSVLVKYISKAKHGPLSSDLQPETITSINKLYNAITELPKSKQENKKHCEKLRQIMRNISRIIFYGKVNTKNREKLRHHC